MVRVAVSSRVLFGGSEMLIFDADVYSIDSNGDLNIGGKDSSTIATFTKGSFYWVSLVPPDVVKAQ